MIAITGLQEFEDLVRETRYAKTTLQRVFRVLMARQFIFANDHGSKDIYEILSDERVRAFADRAFDMFGWRLELNTAQKIKMAYLMPPVAEDDSIDRDKRVAFHAPPLRVDEAIAILLLRAYYDTAITTTGLKDGSAEWHTDGFHDLWKDKTGREPPAKMRMFEILRFLRNHGLIAVSLPQTFHDGLPFSIKPSISFVAVAEPLEALENYAKVALQDNEQAQSVQ